MNPIDSTMDRRAFVAGLLALSATPALARLMGSEAGRADATFFDWREVAADAFATAETTTGGNVLAIRSKGEVLLIDSKFTGMAPTLHDEAAALGDKLVGLINTHHHGDHTGGNLAFVGKVPVHAHINAVPRVAEGLPQYVGSLRGAAGQIARAGRPNVEAVLAAAAELLDRASDLTPEDFIPTHPIEGNEAEVTVGDERVRLTYVGSGHTDNDLIIHLPARNLVHAGDLVFNGLHPFFDTSAGVNARGWIRSLKHLHAMCDADTVVIPGHGGVTNREGVQTQIDYIDQLIAAVQQGIDEGRSKEELAKQTWPFMEGLGFQSIRSRAIAAVYDELIAEG